MLFQRICFFLFKQLGHSWNDRESRGENTIQNQANVWLIAIGQIIDLRDFIIFLRPNHVNHLDRN
jgi:hypothetical protein